MLPENVVFILNRLKEKGFDAYSVGGCVRDRLLNKTPYDWDITTNALPLEIKDIFKNFNLNLKGLKHGTVGVIINGEMIEITTYRIDGEYLDQRRPKNVAFTSDLKKDLSRRDFTVNAMAMDINEKIIDEFNGMEDLQNRIIRTVGDPEIRFNEDALRIMRGLRFASTEGFILEENTLKASNDLSPNLKNIAYERIYTELKKMLVLPNAFSVLEKTRTVFENIFPTLKTDSWEETVKNIKDCNCDFPLALMMLLSDADTKTELERLKVETKLKRLIMNTKELLNRQIKNEKVFLQKLMCEYSKEQILFLCKYLTITTGEDYNKNAQKAAMGITSIKELDITGEQVKMLGYKSYKIKEALNKALIAVMEEKVENKEKALKEFLKK